MKMNNNGSVVTNFIGSVLIISGVYTIGHMNGYKKGHEDGHHTIKLMLDSYIEGLEAGLEQKESKKQKGSE